MPRTIQATVDSDITDELLARLGSIEGVTGLLVHHGASVQPQGDVIVVQATNEASRAVLERLSELDADRLQSIESMEPSSRIAREYQNGLDRESNETIWEEMASLLRRDTNLSANYLLLMFLSGMIAAVGLWTDTVHIVVGAMVIAPGFEPLLRIPFGLIGGPRVLASRGVLSSVVGYLLLVLGAAVAAHLLAAVDPSRSADLHSREWVGYWSQVTATGVLTAIIGGAAGAVVVTAQRPVLSVGVMIALALIPSASLIGMGLAFGDPILAGQAFTRWAVETLCVISAGGIVLGAKQILVHRRRALG